MLAPDQSETARPSRGELALLAGIVLIGGLLRLLFVLWVTHSPEVPLGDELSYLHGAEEIDGGELFTNSRGPGYPAFLVLCRWVAGEPASTEGLRTLEIGDYRFEVAPRHITAGRIGNVGLGVAMIIGIWALGRSLFDRRVGLVAAAWLTLHTRHVTFPLYLAAENLYTAAAMAGIYLCCRAARSKSPLTSIAAGAAFGIGALSRDMLLIFSPLAALVSALALRGERRLDLRCAGLVVFGTLATIAFWTERNYAVYGQVIPIGFSEGIPLFEGNYDGGKGDEILAERARREREYFLRGRQRYLSENATSLPPGANHGRVYANAKLKRDALRIIRERQPTWLFEKIASNGPRLIAPLVNRPEPWKVVPAESSEGVKMALGVVFFPLHFLLLVMAPLGAASWNLRGREALAVSFLLYSFLVHTVANAGISRFQYPYDWVLVLMAASALRFGIPATPARRLLAGILLALVLVSQCAVPECWTGLMASLL